jgi:hypothetical protein
LNLSQSFTIFQVSKRKKIETLWVSACFFSEPPVPG